MLAVSFKTQHAPRSSETYDAFIRPVWHQNKGLCHNQIPKTIVANVA